MIPNLPEYIGHLFLICFAELPTHSEPLLWNTTCSLAVLSKFAFLGSGLNEIPCIILC